MKKFRHIFSSEAATNGGGVGGGNGEPVLMMVTRQGEPPMVSEEYTRCLEIQEEEIVNQTWEYLNSQVGAAAIVNSCTLHVCL